jgi:glucokinase
MNPIQVAAIDVGGTTIKGALMNEAGTLSPVHRIPTDAVAGADAVVRHIQEMSATLLAEARPVAIGLGVPGIIDEVAGIARFATNIPWRNVPLRDLLAEKTGLPVALGHDVRCGALAEGKFGSAMGQSDYVFVALGTGVGSGIVINHRLYIGRQSLGGELGHTVVDPHGPLCFCGKQGCLEAVSSAGAVSRHYCTQANVPPGSVTAEAVAERAAAGDALARTILGEAAEALGLSLANYAALLNPGCIVIGGGLAEAGASFLEATKAAFRRWSDAALQDTPICPAQLGVHAGLIGAGILALESIKTGGKLAHA